MYKRDIYLDIDDELNNYIKSVELDSNSRVWHFHLTVDYEPLDLTGKSVHFIAEKPDKTNVLNDCKIVDAEKGVVEVKLTRQVNAIPGHVKCLLKIIGDEGFVLKTKTFVVDVSKTLSDDATIVSSDEFGALEAALGKVQDIDNRFAQTNAQLSETQIMTNKLDKTRPYFNVIEFGAVGDGEVDDTQAFEKALIEVGKHNNAHLFIPSGTYKISNSIVQSFDYAPQIYGAGQNKTKIVPTDALKEGSYLFEFKAKEFSGGAITGLSISNLTIDMKDSYAHVFKLSSLHDTNKIESITITNLFGHAIYFSSKSSSDSIAYNCSESTSLIRVTIKGRKYIPGNESTYSLIKAGEDNLSSSSNMVNEINIENCRFYANPYTTITGTSMSLNKRSVIELATYSVGWDIHNCMINTVYGAPAIKLGIKENLSKCTSRGHRIYSNCFENCGHHGEPQDNKEYIAQNAIILVGGSDYQNINHIFDNRFEKPIKTNYKYAILSSGNTIFEGGLTASDIYAPSGSNQIMTFGNLDRNLSETIGNQHKNAIMSTFGEFFAMSSGLLITSRKDVKSGNGIDQNTKPQLLFGCNVTETDMSKYCGFKMVNESYESPKLAYVVNGTNIFYLNPDGSITFKNLTEEPASAKFSLAVVNGQLKFKNEHGVWRNVTMTE